MDPTLPSRLVPVAAVLAALSPLPAAALGTPTPSNLSAQPMGTPVIERVTQLRERLLQLERLTPEQRGNPAPLLAQTWNNWKKWNNA